MSEQSGFPQTASRPELLVGGSDASLRRILYDVTALADRIEQMRSEFANVLGVSKPQYNIMLYLAQHQGEVGLTSAQLADALYVSRPHIAKETQALIELGLVEKAPNPADGRSVLSKTTPQGMLKLHSLAPLLREVNDRLFASLSRESVMSLAGHLAPIVIDAERVLQRMPGYLGDHAERLAIDGHE